jgi:hypothetical protein
MRTDSIKVDLKLLSGEISGTWKPDETEAKASWEMYVELITRVSRSSPQPDEGLLREALDTLECLCGTTREILRKYGAIVAQPSGGGDLAFGSLAIAVLNLCLRPVMVKWCLLLQEWESQKPAHVSASTHEQNWDQAAALRQELEEVRAVLGYYASLLEKAAGVPPPLADRRTGKS